MLSCNPPLFHPDSHAAIASCTAALPSQGVHCRAANSNFTGHHFLLSTNYHTHLLASTRCIHKTYILLSNGHSFLAYPLTRRWNSICLICFFSRNTKPCRRWREESNNTPLFDIWTQSLAMWYVASCCQSRRDGRDPNCNPRGCVWYTVALGKDFAMVNYNRSLSRSSSSALSISSHDRKPPLSPHLNASHSRIRHGNVVGSVRSSLAVYQGVIFQ